MRFVCDDTLGKLAKYLRILGFDTHHVRDINLIKYYKNEADKPFLLTRRLGAKTPYDKCIKIKSDSVDEQLKEIRDMIIPFIQKNMPMSRCLHCNDVLIDIKKIDIEQFVPEYVLHNHERFKSCPSCKKVYWQGTHADHMVEWIEKFTAEKPTFVKKS